MPMCSWIQHLDRPELCEGRNCQRHPEAKPFPELLKHKSDCNGTQKRHNRSVFPISRYFEWKKVVDQESNRVSRDQLNSRPPSACDPCSLSFRAKCCFTPLSLFFLAERLESPRSNLSACQFIR